MKILLLGGYGTFGRRLADSLAQHSPFELVIAGRSLAKAQLTRDELRPFAPATNAIALDIHNDDLVAALIKIAPDIVVNASGPFQLQRNDSNNNYLLARACIETGCHYVDLADDRGFVNRFPTELHDQAMALGVSLVTGASTVPGLSSCVLDHYLPDFSELHTLDYGISPGNRSRKGRGTVESILSYTGKPFLQWREGKPNTVYGWQGLRRYDFGDILGKRWLGYCDIPDLDCLKKRYPQLRNIRFQAGLEVSFLHLSLWLLSWLPRTGLIKNLSSVGKFLTDLSEKFEYLGSDAGGMYMNLSGIDHRGNPKHIHWRLIAEQGSGPNVPTIAAELAIKKIAAQKVDPGAHICMGLFSLQEFFQVAVRWGIYQECFTDKHGQLQAL